MPRFITLFFGLFLLTACSPPAEPPKKSEPLKIAISLWTGYAYAFIAQEQGFFKKRGVDVELVFKKDYEAAFDLYKTGEADGVFSAFTDIIAWNSDGANSQAVYITDYSENGDVIIGRPELNSLRDLKGKTVAFEGLGSFSQLFVVKSLEKAGIQEGEFSTANILSSEMLKALDTGTIDAGHIWEPTVMEATKKGYKILAKAADIPGIIIDTLNFHTRVVESRSADIQAVVNALSDAFNFVQTQRKKAITIIAKLEGVPEEEITQGISNIHLLNLAENVAAMQPDGTLFKSGEMTVDFFLKKGQLPRLPNLEAIINSTFVKNAR